MLTMVCNSLAVRSVLFQEAQEPLNGLLVVLVLLALHNDFLATVDKLVTTLFREVLLQENLLGTIVVLVGTVLVLLRNTVGEVVLKECQHQHPTFRQLMAGLHTL